jgi:hypothetical protein
MNARSLPGCQMDNLSAPISRTPSSFQTLVPRLDVSADRVALDILASSRWMRRMLLEAPRWWSERFGREC